MNTYRAPSARIAQDATQYIGTMDPTAMETSSTTLDFYSWPLCIVSEPSSTCLVTHIPERNCCFQGVLLLNHHRAVADEVVLTSARQI